MVTFVYSPWGIPANYRMMQGSGVNTYKWVNSEGKAVLVKYHWEPLQGIKNLTQKKQKKSKRKILIMPHKIYMMPLKWSLS